MYLSSNSEVYLKQTFNIDVFILKLWSIIEVYFPNLWIYVQTQNIFEVDFQNKLFIFKLGSILDFISKKSRTINKVLLKYKQSTFGFFSVFILHLYSFLGSSLKAYFYWTSRISSVNKVYPHKKINRCLTDISQL